MLQTSLSKMAKRDIVLLFFIKMYMASLLDLCPDPLILLFN